LPSLGQERWHCQFSGVHQRRQKRTNNQSAFGFASPAIGLSLKRCYEFITIVNWNQPDGGEQVAKMLKLPNADSSAAR